MGAQHVPDAARIEAPTANVRDYAFGPHTCTYIDQSELSPAVDQVDVAVVWIREIEPE
jgi:hypothetical protein